MSVEVHGTAQAEPAVVWRLMGDVLGWPAWLPTVTSVRARTPGRDGVGARYTVQQPRLPVATWTITDWQPGRCFTWQTRTPGLRTTASHVVTARADGGSDIQLAVVWTGMLAPVARLTMGRLSADYVQRELRALIGASAAA